MSASSVAVYNRWRDLMRSWGFTVLEAGGCDTQSASSRAVDPSGAFLEHHDASSALGGNWGSLATILAGRTGIPPRLANLQFARDGQVMITCKNVANHGGTGGPKLGIPVNDINVHSCGAEVANNGLGEPYGAALVRSLVHGEAAWAIVHGRTAEHVFGHKEWAVGRKIDPIIDMNARRAAVAAVIRNGGPLGAVVNPFEEDDMPATFLIRADKGAGKPADLYWCGPGFGQPIKSPADTTSLRKQCDEYNVTDELAQRVLSDIRAGKA